jgi:hypothetical protein
MTEEKGRDMKWNVPSSKLRRVTISRALALTEQFGDLVGTMFFCGGGLAVTRPLIWVEPSSITIAF